jgi:hypothetical protein
MDSTSQPLPPELLAYFKRNHEIAQLTNDEQVRIFWSHWNERTPGRLDLVVSGQVAWESPNPREIELGGVGWIRPTTTEPVDSETSVRFPISFEHEYAAGVPVVDATDAQPGLVAIHEGIARADLITNALSFLTGFPVTWRPARVLDVVDKPGPEPHDGKERRYKKYFPLPSNGENTSIVIKDEWVAKEFATFVRVVWDLKPKLRDVFLTAISWQAQANRVGGFSRYLHYWASVELLAGFFWNELPSTQTQRVPDSEIKQRVLELLLDLKGSNYVETINKCNDVLEPSARTQVKALARLIEFDSDVFFKRETKDAKSVLDVRNDIAHGNVANDDRTYATAHRAVLEQYQRQTQQFVFKVIASAATGKFQI